MPSSAEVVTGRCGQSLRVSKVSQLLKSETSIADSTKGNWQNCEALCQWNRESIEEVSL